MACLVLKPDTPQHVRLHQFAVAPAHQRQGYGSLLLRQAEEFAWRHGYREIIMHARETAVGFYEKLGYAKHGDRFIEVTIPHYQMQRMLADPVRTGSGRPLKPHHC
jgi:ribosomal protein S18 acetylase RimI-like enzyme